MKKVLYLLAMPLLMMACNKEAQQPAKSAQLRTGKWKLTSYSLKFYDSTYKRDSVYNVYLNVVPACVKDNFLQFLVNYEGHQLLEGEKCASGENQNEKFEWELVNNEKGLNFYNVALTLLKQNLRTEIVEWQESQIRCRYKELNVLNDNYGDTLTYTFDLTRN